MTPFQGPEWLLGSQLDPPRTRGGIRHPGLGARVGTAYAVLPVFGAVPRQLAMLAGVCLEVIEMAPKPMPKAPRRTAMVTIRFTPLERDRAEDLARAAGVSISDYGRAQMLEVELPQRPSRPGRIPGRPIPAVNQDAYQAFARAGNNLNQLARSINHGSTPELRKVHATLGDLRDAVSRVGRALVGAESTPHYEFGENPMSI
jgi:hypothetical protein